MPRDLALDTAVHPLRPPGTYGAALSSDWSYIAPSGGVLMTVALRAMQAELADPSFQLLSANAIFASPLPAGPLLARVELLRRGNAASQLRASLAAPGESGVGLEVSATFVRARTGPALADPPAPAVSRPADAPPIERISRVTKNSMPFFANFEWRAAGPIGWWEGGSPTSEARWMRWVRYLVPQRLPGGCLDPLAIPPLADTMPPAVAQKLGPESRPFRAPSLDLTIHFLAPIEGEWLLVSNEARHARAGYASAEVEIWDETGRLVAYATQTMMLRERRSPSSQD